MKLSELPNGSQSFTQLGTRVLAVLTKGPDGYRVYVGAVPGVHHHKEWQAVADVGDKQKEPIAKAIVEHLFHPGFEVDLPYVS